MFEPGDGPRVFDIPSGTPFAEMVARGILDRLPRDDPTALASLKILAPTRRGARTIADALVSLAGGPILVPRILTLGSVEALAPPAPDLPPAIDPLHRVAILTRLVRALAQAMPHLAGDATAVSLAQALASLIDQAQGERLPLDRLAEIVPDDHAEHWGETLRFLDILREAWPALLGARGEMDPVARRADLIARTIRGWQIAPPQTPYIVAGSTGSVGISAELIAAIARLPQGAVILPGLDRDLDGTTFRDLADAGGQEGQPEHPQNGLARLLHRLGGEDGPLPRDRVRHWAGETSPRSSFVSLAMRPAPVTDQWMKDGRTVMQTAEEALDGIALIEADTPQEEASVIAIAMRETLETEGRTVALITTDRTLSRRVTAALARWGIRPDDSAGIPLSGTPPGMFVRQVAEYGFALTGADRPQDADPVPLLAMLKHPLCRLGMEPGASRRIVRRVEIAAMRSDHATGADLAAIRAVFADPEEGDAAAIDWLDRLKAALAPLAALSGTEVDFGEAVSALADSLHLMGVDAAGDVELWEGPNGIAAQSFLADMSEAGREIGPVAPASIPAMLMAFMASRTARAPFGQHPRAAIWGTLEARMQSADRVILAGLNEDGWPSLPANDPWMSRGMRATFGLAPLERRIGLAAHDFEQALCAKDVILTRARKTDGTPNVPSRWLQRIMTLLGERAGRGFAPETLAKMRRKGERYRDHAAWLATPEGETRACDRPAPRPPVAARPMRLSITEIETLIRDPYAIYARHVLRLRPLDGLVPEPDALTRGEVMHGIVERFVRSTQAHWPTDPAERQRLFALATNEALADLHAWPVFQLLYRSRAERIADWFIAEEDARRQAGGRPALLEGKGSLAVDIEAEAPFRLTARVDRIDHLQDGFRALYDYKGATAPSAKQVLAGWAQQLPLQAAMLQEGGFEIERGKVRHIAYIQLLGGTAPGREIAIPDAEELIANALPRLQELLMAYMKPETAYLSHARPERTDFEGNYDHLARYGEWDSGEDGDG